MCFEGSEGLRWEVRCVLFLCSCWGCLFECCRLGFRGCVGFFRGVSVFVFLRLGSACVFGGARCVVVAMLVAWSYGVRVGWP